MRALWPRGTSSTDEWTRRMLGDRIRAERNQTPEQLVATGRLLARALELGAEGFALTGSTARCKRTSISDLDYHVIGPRPNLSDMPGDVDVVSTSAKCFLEKLLSGDDFAQWTLRYGCILHDTGVMREGIRLITDKQLWPDARRKLDRLADLRREADRLVCMGDRDAAQDQLRATLTSAARALLLEANVFPLARRELPGQLERIGHRPLARALDASIYQTLELTSLVAHLRVLDDTLAVSARRSAA
jgi:hypothetical protein